MSVSVFAWLLCFLVGSRFHGQVHSHLVITASACYTSFPVLVWLAWSPTLRVHVPK